MIHLSMEKIMEVFWYREYMFLLATASESGKGASWMSLEKWQPVPLFGKALKLKKKKSVPMFPVHRNTY